ncbi:BQ2448_2409 [Microbotryum intermedium]|uniref:BQ2448_2409 protein n=1 Tax=Microbotryum intermedium TaxID=269621 RepID=A0A238F9F7_9BASI|nr:BQ2448_2409 [Microbotryum intermedium]
MSRLRRSSLPSHILTPFPSSSISPSSTAPSRISTVALGTAYELATRQFLSQPPLSLHSLLRIGGSNDKGIDLRGFFYTLPRPTSSLVETDETSTRSPARRPKRRLPVIIQCKAVSKPLPPSIIREFEGVLSTEPKCLGILVGMNGFTELAIKRAFASEFPIGLLRLGKGVLGREVLGGVGGGDSREEDGSWDLGVNKAMRDLVGEDVGGLLLSGVKRKWGEKFVERDKEGDEVLDRVKGEDLR